jgi:hypothetical protein
MCVWAGVVRGQVFGFGARFPDGNVYHDFHVNLNGSNVDCPCAHTGALRRRTDVRHGANAAFLFV